MDDEFIEVAYIFEQNPGEKLLRFLFQGLIAYSSEKNSSGELEIVYWDENGKTHKKTGGAEAAATVCNSAKSASIRVPFDGFKLRIGPDNDRDPLASVPHLSVRETIHPFREIEDDHDDTNVKQRRQRFANALAEVASNLDPLWAFGRRGGVAVGVGESTAELATSLAPPLYEYNVFRSEAVEAIGRECVLSAPAWFVEELNSGSVFLAVREPPKQCSSRVDACVEVADHLGIQMAKTERYD